MPIPDLNEDGVLPPHKGDLTNKGDMSPFSATTLELCEKFGETPQRRKILRGLLEMRSLFNQLQITTGFQWVDGPFLEDFERRNRKAPDAIKVVTFCRESPLLSDPHYTHLIKPLLSVRATRSTFSVDHSLIPLEWPTHDVIEHTRYQSALLSHQSETNVWKGFVKINLNTPHDDQAALEFLAAKDEQ